MIEIKPKVLDTNQFKQLVSVIENSKDEELQKIQYSLLVSLVFTLGMRIGECLSLTFNDICITSRILTIRSTWDYVNNLITSPKTRNSYRTGYIGDTAFVHFEKLLNYYKETGNYSNDLPLFSSFSNAKRREGQVRISPTTVRRKISKYLELSNLNHMRIHDFRHSFSTELHNQKIPVEIAAKSLGDSLRTTHEVYSHISRKTQKEISKLFD